MAGAGFDSGYIQKGCTQTRSGVPAGWAGGDFASAIGHIFGHLKDIGKACTRDSAAGIGVLLLLGDGAVRVVAKSVVLVVGA
jgi:hypothetical protein